MHLRLQDFKTLSIKVVWRKKITEEDMLEKTFTTLHASNVLLYLLVVEQNNELLMRNHQSRSTGFEPFPEVNAISSQTHGRGRGQGRGRNPRYHGSYSNNSQKMKTKQENEKRLQDKPHKNHENNCYRCGMKRHWSHTCRTPKHLVDLYQASIKAKGKEIDMNFTDGDGLDLTYYDIDFFGDCATTHTILRDKRYFLELTLIKANKFNDPKFFVLWHDMLGHLGSSMMCRIIEHSHVHLLKNQKILLSNEYSCAACSQDKLIVRPSFTKVISESPIFLERIHGDISSVTHTHTQNGLAKSFIKHLQLIARPLLMKTKLSTSIRPTIYHEYSPSQLVLGKQPNISHLRIFGCTVYVPIAPIQRTKMGPQRRIEIYVGFDSPSIIRYLEHLTCDVFTPRFTDCHFNESVFLSLGGEKSIPEERREISWKASTMTHLDSRTNQCELEVQRIIHLQNLANQLLDGFIDTKKVTKSHISAANTLAQIDILRDKKLGTLENAIKMIDQFQIDKSIALEEAHIEREALEEAHIEQETPEKAQIPENCEISVNYVHMGEKWDQNNIVINNIFAFQVASDVIRNDEDPEPRNMKEFIGYKWVFVRKRNENNEIIRYKARLVAQVYVDDLNLVRTPEELTRTTNYLKKEFEMKNLGIFFFSACRSTHPLSFPMIVRSLDMKKDPFRPCKKKEELLGLKVPYLSAIGALMYLANCTHPNIAFSVNLLARYNSHKGRSQTGYVFNCNGTAISWKSVKQTMVATSSNHSEILAIHKASRECIWLRSMIQHIRESCGLFFIKDDLTILFEENVTCIAQITGGYIKGDRTKHISPKFFYTHELQKSGEIDVQQIRSSDNLADLFTKSLPTSIFKKLINKIGMRQLKDIDMRRSMLVKGC
ncbi:hypothetical protein AAG906_015377 [Vitis piasezkii]